MSMFDPVNHAIESSPMPLAAPLSPRLPYKHNIFASPTYMRAPGQPMYMRAPAPAPCTHMHAPVPSASMHAPAPPMYMRAPAPPRPGRHNGEASGPRQLDTRFTPGRSAKSMGPPPLSPHTSRLTTSVGPPPLPQSVPAPTGTPYAPKRISPPGRIKVPLTPHERATMESVTHNTLRTGVKIAPPLRSRSGPPKKSAWRKKR